MRVLAPPQVPGRVCMVRRGRLEVFELEDWWKGKHRMQAQT